MWIGLICSRGRRSDRTCSSRSRAPHLGGFHGLRAWAEHTDTSKLMHDQPRMRHMWAPKHVVAEAAFGDTNITITPVIPNISWHMYQIFMSCRLPFVEPEVEKSVCSRTATTWTIEVGDFDKPATTWCLDPLISGLLGSHWKSRQTIKVLVAHCNDFWLHSCILEKRFRESHRSRCSKLSTKAATGQDIYVIS